MLGWRDAVTYGLACEAYLADGSLTLARRYALQAAEIDPTYAYLVDRIDRYNKKGTEQRHERPET